MLVTNDHAKTLVCPHLTRMQGTTVPLLRLILRFLRHDTSDPVPPDEPAKCLGDGCMWWRWWRPLPEDNNGHPHGQGDVGYCGVAGAPLPRNVRALDDPLPPQTFGGFGPR
jgi:hypothetical protein